MGIYRQKNGLWELRRLAGRWITYKNIPTLEEAVNMLYKRMWK